jgi:phosphopantetheine--protein transferase-like protein
MRLRRLGLSLGTGIDICRISRIVRLVQNPNERVLQGFIRRILTLNERQSFQSLNDNHDQVEVNNAYRSSVEELEVAAGFQPEATTTGRDRRAEWLAGRFAAKEAIRKALGTDRVHWKDIEVFSPSHQASSVESNPTKLAAVDKSSRAATVEVLKHLDPKVWAAVRLSSESTNTNSTTSNTITRNGSTVVQTCEDEWIEVALSIAHDGDYAVASCIVDKSYFKQH